MPKKNNAPLCTRWEPCRKPRPKGECPFSRRDLYEGQPPKSHLKWHPLDDSIGEEEGCDEYNDSLEENSTKMHYSFKIVVY